MANENFNGLFNQTGVPAPTSTPTDEYRVSYKKGKNGMYQSVIRFVPYVENTDKSIMKKNVVWLVNPVTKTGKYIDNPNTIGEPSVLTSLYWSLINTKNAQLEEFAKKHLGGSVQYASIIQVISDPQQPDLEGKLLIFKYGKKIYDKIYAENYPAMDEGYNPFDIFEGRFFSLTCTAQSQFNNYDQSQFFTAKGNSPSGLRFINKAGKLEVADANTSDKQAIFDFLKTSSPDLSKFDFRPWDNSTTEFVNSTVAIISNYAQTGSLPLSTETAFSKTPMDTKPQFPGVTSTGGYTQNVPTPQPLYTQHITKQPIAPQMNAPQMNVPQQEGIGVTPPNIGTQHNGSESDVFPSPLGNLDDILSGHI